MMVTKVGCVALGTSRSGLITNSNELLPESEDSQAPQTWPCGCPQDAPDGLPNCYCSAAGSAADGLGDNEGGCGDPADPGGFNDAELEAILREFIGTLIGLLQPHYAEVVWRAEILDQTPPEIAQEMNLSERKVTERLRAGRRALLHLVMMTLQPPSEA